MKETTSEWYATWFDTEYYHTLYKNRNFEEAKNFMQKLTSSLDLKQDAHILDVACGRGRHAIYLNKLGYRVTGIDLSKNNIAFAKAFENDTLKFIQHDMCIPMDKQYDALVNLFTSFGYFEDDKDNVKAIRTMKKNLKPDGTGVIDFLNIHKTIDNLKAYEVKTIDGIEFHISKRIEDGHIIKEIAFETEGQSHKYREKLKCLDLKTFQSYLNKADLKIIDLYGDYNLNPYDTIKSDRLIFTFKHK